MHTGRAPSSWNSCSRTLRSDSPGASEVAYPVAFFISSARWPRTLGMQEALLSVIALAGIALVAYGLRCLWRLRIISEWPQVKATIVSAELVNVSSGREDAPQFRPQLKYEYSAEGKMFRSAVLGISDSAFDFHSENEAQEFMAKVNPGHYADVLVNPAVPHDVFLAPGASRMRRNHYATAIASGVLVLLAGAAAWWMMHA